MLEAPTGPAPRAFRVPDAADRDDLANFVGRVVRLDSSALVRLRAAERGTVGVWASSKLDVTVARAVRGECNPADTTVSARELLTALAVLHTAAVDPGAARDSAWRTALPPLTGFVHLDDVPATVFAELADRGVALAREHPGPDGRAPTALLDQEVLMVRGAGAEVAVPLRCVFALSGMGFVGEGGDDPVRVRASPGWLRLDARYGSVLRRRHPPIPLLVR